MKRIFALFAFLCSFSGNAQVVTSTLYATEDTYSNSGAVTTNYGTSGNLELSKTATSVYRSFLKFDLSGIPANAVIAVALLKLTPDGTENVTATNSTQLFADLVNTSWSESTLNFNSNLNNNTATPSMITSNLVSGKRVFDLRAQLQGIVDGCYSSEGWRIRRSNESTNVLTKYFSRENGTASNRPQLEIQYYIRPYVSAANIVHTSTLLGTDGSISPTVVNGSATTMNYRWYNSGGTQVGTAQNLTGVGSGWYGLKCYGSIAGDTTFHAFVVGTVGQNVSFTFYPGPNYVDDSRIMDHTTGSGTSISRSEQAIAGGATFFGAARFFTSSVWGSERSLIRYRLWVDPVCTVENADLILYGVNHIFTDSSNASEFNRLTSQWTENGVAHINRPTHTTTGKINLAALPTGNTNDTVDISGFYNIWKNNNLQNYGMLFQLKSYPPIAAARMAFGTGDATITSTRPKIEFTISVPPDLSTTGTLGITYDATNTYADVTLTLSPPSGAVSPYHYMISEQPIPNFGDIYKTLKDTIFDGVLDSVKFYLGDNNTSLTNQFTSLKQGQYYISAFDKLGVRIYDRLVSINPINYETSSSISFADDVFTTSAANGKAVMTDYLTEASEAASITYTVLANTGESFFGLQNLSSPLAVKTDIYYGFHVQSGSARVISAGVVGGTPYVVTATDEFSIVKDGSNLKFYISGVLKATAALPSTFIYKSVVFAAGSATKIKYRPVHLFPFSFVFNIMNPVVPGSCLGSFGQVSGAVWALNFGYKVPVNFSTVLKNSSNVVQTMDAGATAIAYSYSNLLPGNYTLTITFNWQVNSVVNLTPIVYTYNIVVASRISWENKVAATDVSTPLRPFPLLATTTGIWGHASSVNTVIPSPTNTFVDFTPNIGGYFYFTSASWPFINLITLASGTGVLGFADPSATALTTNVPAIFTGYYFTKTLLGPYTILKREGTGTPILVGTFAANDKFRFVFNPTTNKGSLYKYSSANVLGAQISTSIITYTNPAIVKNLISYVKTKNNTGFINFSTNMMCPVNTIYAKLERELKGVKYAVNLNKFYFFYDEEYSSTTSLTYNVYDKNNTVVLKTATQVLTQTISNQPNREYGDNRYYLDVTSLAAGSYVLEVVNEKEEKFYLRFIK